MSMSSEELENASQMVETVFADLLHDYGMNVTIKSNGLLVASPRSKVTISFGRSGIADTGMLIYAGVTGPFKPWYIELLRNHFKLYRSSGPKPSTNEQEFLEDLEWLNWLLRTFCTDLLGGDASKLVEREHYFEFEKFLNRAFFYSALNPGLKLGDTSATTGDWTWLKEPWARHLRGELPFPDRPEV